MRDTKSGPADINAAPSPLRTVPPAAPPASGRAAAQPRHTIRHPAGRAAPTAGESRKHCADCRVERCVEHRPTQSRVRCISVHCRVLSYRLVVCTVVGAQQPSRSPGVCTIRSLQRVESSNFYLRWESRSTALRLPTTLITIPMA